MNRIESQIVLQARSAGRACALDAGESPAPLSTRDGVVHSPGHALGALRGRTHGTSRCAQSALLWHNTLLHTMQAAFDAKSAAERWMVKACTSPHVTLPLTRKHRSHLQNGRPSVAGLKSATEFNPDSIAPPTKHTSCTANVRDHAVRVLAHTWRRRACAASHSAACLRPHARQTTCCSIEICHQIQSRFNRATHQARQLHCTRRRKRARSRCACARTHVASS